MPLVGKDRQFSIHNSQFSIKTAVFEDYDIVLGSHSPRRQQLLSDLGIKFRVEVIEGIAEDYPADMPADDVAQFLAIQKAKPYRLSGNEMLITADTIVWLDGKVLGKPKDEEDACRMLRILSGKTHQVYTGVCLTGLDKQISFVDKTDVSFRKLAEEEIQYYVGKYKPLDKAGAYGIQEWIGMTACTGINGSYFNVMGLPVHRVTEEMRKFG